MPAPWGVQPSGFNKKPSSTSISEIDAGLQKILGKSSGTEPDGSIPLNTVAGQIKSLVADVVTSQWDGQQAIYATGSRDTAKGTALDAIGGLTGTKREPLRASTASVTCTGTPGTVLQPTRVVQTTDTAARFDSLAIATIIALDVWQGTHGYVVGQRVTNVAKCYQCITGGTSAGVGGPTTTAADITDGTAHWRYLGNGTGAVDVTFSAEVPGPLGAVAGQLTLIQTPVSGWSSAINLSDATPGAVVETDPAYRVRQQQDLATSNGGTEGAIKAVILKVNQGSTDPAHLPVKSCRVFLNRTDTLDANGLPPHSVEVMAFYGLTPSATTDQDIAQAVWNAVGGGINYYGNQNASVVDSQGENQTIQWTKPASVPIYIVTTTTYDPTVWKSGAPAMAQATKSALATYGDSYPVGESVRARSLSAAVFRGPSALDTSGIAVVPATDGSPPIPGVLDSSPMNIGAAPGPATETTIAIGVRQIATFSTSNMTVTATPGTP